MRQGRTVGRPEGIFPADLEALFQTGMVSIWREGGTGRIHSARRERETPSPALDISADGMTGKSSFESRVSSLELNGRFPPSHLPAFTPQHEEVAG